MVGDRISKYGLFTAVFILLVVCTTSAQDFLDCVSKNPMDEDCRVLILDKIREKAFPITTGDAAYFAYVGKADTVRIAGDHTRWRLDDDHVFTMVDEELFLFKEDLPSDARFDYKIVADGKWMLDPANDQTIQGGFGPNSECAMPKFELPAEVNYHPGIPAGTLDTLLIGSHILDTSFGVIVYKPPGYNSMNQRKYQSIYVHDGFDYIRLGSALPVLDNLIHEEKIPPVVVIFVQPNNRNQEYAYGDRYAFAAFIVNELMPSIEDEYYVSGNPYQKGMIGASFGANITGVIAKEYGAVQRLGLHSAALHPNEGESFYWLMSEAPDDFRYCLIRGSFEPGINDQSTLIAHSLKAKGYDIYDNVYPDGHSWGLWRRTLGEMLIYLLSD